MKLALVVIGLSGCDLLFDVHRLEIPAGDAGSPDGHDNLADAGNCGTHDEDGDGVFDKCDKCPTIFDPNDGDTDGDGVGNLCDPDPGPANTIDAFYSFQTGIAFTGNGDTYPNDTMRLDGTVVSNRMFAAPEVIDVSIANLAIGPSAEIVMNPGGSTALTCQLATICANSAPTCLFVFDTAGELAKLDLALLPAEVSSLVMYRDGTGEVHCSVNDLAIAHTVTAVGAMIPDGKLELLAP
ncbi:MAG TPA: hypothetical protein VFQ65_14420, partial [Kofleriaceae bacterium]|nr:hypothetical protein [Kofleriaceae bacterium]